MSRPRFGTAGNPAGFYESGRKGSEQMPAFLAGAGLDAYEYTCGRGVMIKSEKAAMIGHNAAEHGIRMSLHAPYYLSLSSEDPERQRQNVRYMLESCAAADAMGAGRVVVHCGSAGRDRRAAHLRQIENFRLLLRERDEAGYRHIVLCPEIMGKQNQLGDIDEVTDLADLDETVIPCVDFGHLNARTCGGLRTTGDYEAVFDRIADRLGDERTAALHIHFSRIEYRAGGEYRHLTFEDTRFGPFFEPCAEVIAKRGYAPVVICESDGTQDRDAIAMKDTYFEARERFA